MKMEKRTEKQILFLDLGKGWGLETEDKQSFKNHLRFDNYSQIFTDYYGML